MLELESSISLNVRNFLGVDFVNFFDLGLKSASGSPMVHYFTINLLIWGMLRNGGSSVFLYIM